MRQLAALLALGCVTCSLVIAGESAPLHCAQEGELGPPACDEGFTCRAGVCRREAPADGAAEAGGAAASTGGVGSAGEPDVAPTASGAAADNEHRR